jgi:hypothetical protein
MTDEPIPAHQRAELWPEPPLFAREHVELACRLELPGGDVRRIWFRFPVKQAPLLTRMADPMVVAVLLHAMRRCRELVVHGPVSAGLVSNLANFQEAYCAHHPGIGHPVRITAEHVYDDPRFPKPERAITAFSGGVDSMHSLYSHSGRSRTVPKRPLRAALLMHGMDIPLAEPSVFEAVVGRCASVTASAGIDLLTGSTNVRSLPLAWEDQFGTAVAASLLLFQEAFTQALIPSAYSYRVLHPDHGSNPLTDPLLSSSMLQIIHDGAGRGRIEKLRDLSAWPEALAKVRVCWQPGRSDNCGKCEKCLRTQLMLDLCGVRGCPAFPGPISADDIHNLVIRTSGGLNELSYLLAEGRASEPGAPWIGPLASAIARNRRYLRLQAAARGAGAAVPAWVRALAAAAAKRLFSQDGHAAIPASKPSS